MAEPIQSPWLQGTALGETLRAIRTLRRMSQADVARALGVSRRTYIELEAGQGRMGLEQLVAFADLTNSDRFALVLAVIAHKPSLAVRFADNKLMTILAFALEDFEAAVGDDAVDVRPHELMTAAADAFARLAAGIDRRKAERSALTGRTKGAPPPSDAQDVDEGREP